jgi:hypothetical protein
MARTYSLTAGFKAGAAKGAELGSNPLVGLPLAAVTVVAGAALGVLALAGTAATAGLMFAAFFSMMTYNPLNIILLTALGVGTAYGTSLAFRGSARMLGMAKGAMFDDAVAAPAAKAAQPSPAAPAPQAQYSVPKFSGVPRSEFFNLSAAPRNDDVKLVAAQPRWTAPKVK